MMVSPNDFLRDGSLRTKVDFEALIQPSEVAWKAKIVNPATEELRKWRTIKDSFGATFTLFDEDVDIDIGEKYHIQGRVKITKGNTYFNVKEVTPLKELISTCENASGGENDTNPDESEGGAVKEP